MNVLSSSQFRGWLGNGAAICALLSSTSLLFVQEARAAEEIDKIVVTANKREQRIQDVPGSVSVATGEQLIARSQSQLSDYAAYIPGFNVTSGGSQGQASIQLRGISTFSGGEAAVATYIDESPMGSSGGFNIAGVQMLDLLPYDLDRLEVLRGPQGTLYGAGAMGGLVKYVLKSPNLDSVEAQVGGEVVHIKGADNFGYATFARGSAPMIPGELAISVSGYSKSTPGFVDNAWLDLEDTNKAESYGGRVAFFWQPSDSFSAKFSALLSRGTSDDNAIETFDATVAASADGGQFAIPTTGYGELTNYHAFPSIFDKDIDHYALTMVWAPGPVEVTSATSYSDQTTHSVGDFSHNIGSSSLILGLGAPYLLLAQSDDTFGVKRFTQEIRVASAEPGTFDWILGGYFDDEEASNRQIVNFFDTTYTPFPLLTPGFDASLPTTYNELAVFGSLTWNVTEKLSGTGGFRFARNKQDYTVTCEGFPGFCPIPIGTQLSASTKEEVVTWSFDAKYSFADDMMAYARVASGYRPGSPNNPLPGVPTTVDSDSLINYELGLRSELLDRSLLLNLTLFRVNWSDIQTAARTPGGINYFANGGKAISQGFEAESIYSPVEGLSFGLNAAFTSAEFDEISTQPGAAPFLLDTQLPGVPKWAASFTSEYDRQVAGNWRANMNLGLRWVDEMYLDAVQGAGGGLSVVAPSYFVADASLRLYSGPFAFRIFARNLTDERAVLGGGVVSDLLAPASLFPPQIDYVVLQPRTIGVGLTIKY